MIAGFTRDTVFPLIDAFHTTHKTVTNVESGVLVLLAQRMVYHGFSPSTVIELVTQAAEIAVPQPTIAPEVPKKPTVANILPFQR